MHARAGVRASATLQPEAQRIPIPPADHLNATGEPKLTAANGPTSVAKRIRQEPDPARRRRTNRLENNTTHLSPAPHQAIRDLGCKHGLAGYLRRRAN